MADSRSSSPRKSSHSKPYSKRPPQKKTVEGETSERKPWKPRTDDSARPARRGPPSGGHSGGDRKAPNRDAKPRPYGDRPQAPRREARDDYRSRDNKPRFDKPERKPQFEKPAPKRFEDENGNEEWPVFERPSRKVPEGADRLDEIKACGVNACRAIYKARKSDIVRAYVTEETMNEFGDMLKWCAANKKAYHVVTHDDLNKISASTHHEGVCVIAKAKAASWPLLKIKLAGEKTAPALLLILEDVGNPHNVGAIVRSSAHFGVTAVLAPGLETFKPSPALLRTAEGGSEQVDIVATPALDVIAVELRKLGFKILATASNGKSQLYSDGVVEARTALIIGNESRGISAEARKIADSTLAIPGSGTIDSLNVSAATAVLCSEFWRRHRT